MAKIATNSPDYNTNIGKLDRSLEVIPGDGTVQTKDGDVILSKATAAAISLPAPTAGAASAGGDDGKIVRFISTTAAPHVITCPTRGFNKKGSSGTATMTAAIGNSCSFEAYAGDWYNGALINTTIA
jgi:hypothetical protein